MKKSQTKKNKQKTVLNVESKASLVDGCKEAIQEAVFLHYAAIWYGKKDLSKCIFQELLTDHIQHHLYNLIKVEEQESAQDKFYNYFLTLKNLVVGLAQPGVLKKLPQHLRKTAATEIDKLSSFFENISTDLTDAWYDYYRINNLGMIESDEKLKQLIQQYGRDGIFLMRDFKYQQENVKNMQAAAAEHLPKNEGLS